jgi:hypothetical protein
MERCVIRGGQDGYGRLLVLAAPRRPCTLEFLKLAGVRPGMRCVGRHASQVKPARMPVHPEGQAGRLGEPRRLGLELCGQPSRGRVSCR